jgi:hemolysin activation/secretion protein
MANFHRHILWILSICIVSQDIFAVSSPASLNAGQLEKRFEKPIEPLSKPKPVEVERVEGDKSPEGADKVKFKLENLEIEGNSAIDDEEIKSLFSDVIGQEVSLADVYQFATELTAYYGNAGYLLSRAIVPAQTIENGIVKIEVIEGYVDEVVIEGAEGLRQDLFDHLKSKIKASRPLTAKVLERYLLLANDIPGYTFKSVLKPSEFNRGAATLTLTVDEMKPWIGALSLDNRGSESSGPWQILVEGTGNDTFGRMDSTTLRFATVPNAIEELHYWQLSHNYLINGEGLKLNLGFSKTDSKPGGDIYRLYDIKTRGSTFVSALSFPYIRSREENLSVTAQFDMRESDSLNDGSFPESRDKLRALRFGVTYDKADTFAGGGINLLTVMLNQGLDIASARVQSRQLADSDYTFLSLSARRIQQLAEKWSLDVRMNGQYANETLASSEQFGLGGENSVRGYEPSEWTGDSAFTLSGEIKYALDVEWDGSGQLYSFYDYGRVWSKDEADLLIDDSTSIDSVGIGGRFDFPDTIAMNVELAKPFDDHANGDDNDWELYARVTWQF